MSISDLPSVPTSTADTVPPVNPMARRDCGNAQRGLAVPSGDYVSPGLEVILPDAAFPNMVIGSTTGNSWPYLRRDIAHNWYVDQRDPTVGFVNRDEATILYHTARRFAGQPCLEIGCWRGWSTAHIALGCGELHVVDPVLTDECFLADVRGSLERSGILDRVSFYAGPSPSEVESISERSGRRWVFAFIDGNHEGDGPLNDAEIVARFAAPDALVLFHDLLSPDVARGLGFFRAAGWRTMIYQTAQIMGVAWRGAVTPISHIPDPSQPWWLPVHLASYPISGEPPDHRLERVFKLIDFSFAPGRSTSEAEPIFTGSLAGIPSRRAAEEQTAAEIQQRANRKSGDVDALLLKLEELLAHNRELAPSAEAAGRFDEFHRRYLQTIDKLTTLEAEKTRLAANAEEALHDAAQLHSALDEANRDRETLMRVVEQTAGRGSTSSSEAPTAVRAYFSQAERDFIAWVARPRVLLGLLRRRAQLGSQAVTELVGDHLAAHGIDVPPALITWLARGRFLVGLLRRYVLLGKPAVEGALFQELIRLTPPHQNPTDRATSAQAEYKRMASVLEALEAAKVADEKALLDAQIEISTLRARLDGRLRLPASSVAPATGPHSVNLKPCPGATVSD